MNANQISKAIFAGKISDRKIAIMVDSYKAQLAGREGFRQSLLECINLLPADHHAAVNACKILSALESVSA